MRSILQITLICSLTLLAFTERNQDKERTPVPTASSKSIQQLKTDRKTRQVDNVIHYPQYRGDNINNAGAGVASSNTQNFEKLLGHLHSDKVDKELIVDKLNDAHVSAKEYSAEFKRDIRHPHHLMHCFDADHPYWWTAAHKENGLRVHMYEHGRDMEGGHEAQGNGMTIFSNGEIANYPTNSHHYLGGRRLTRNCAIYFQHHRPGAGATNRKKQWLLPSMSHTSSLTALPSNRDLLKQLLFKLTGAAARTQQTLERLGETEFVRNLEMQSKQSKIPTTEQNAFLTLAGLQPTDTSSVGEGGHSHISHHETAHLSNTTPLGGDNISTKIRRTRREWPSAPPRQYPGRGQHREDPEPGFDNGSPLVFSDLTQDSEKMVPPYPIYHVAATTPDPMTQNPYDELYQNAEMWRKGTQGLDPVQMIAGEEMIEPLGLPGQDFAHSEGLDFPYDGGAKQA